MNQSDRLERDLTAWLNDTATPRTPDYADAILRQTARTRQRPRWTFVDRWLPTTVATRAKSIARPVPWRTIGLLAVLALLLAAALAVIVGSPARLPAPFGLADNGLVAYADGGDIFTIDPIRRTPRAIVTGPETDHDPRWSLDGTRLVFLRRTSFGDLPVIADADGRNPFVALTNPIAEVDAESVAWSPDGRSIAMIGRLDGQRDLLIVDAIDGNVTALDADYQGADLYWRPPDGRELMYLGGTPFHRGLFRISVDDGNKAEVPILGSRVDLRPAGWTPDGRSFAYQSAEGQDILTSIIDLDTGRRTVVPVGFPQLSNDGKRIVGLNGDETRTWLCVASVTGGPCNPITPEYPGEWNTYFRWSPDDKWIITTRSDDAVFLLDPDGGTTSQPSWFWDGGASWQRTVD